MVRGRFRKGPGKVQGRFRKGHRKVQGRSREGSPQLVHLNSAHKKTLKIAFMG